LLEASCPGNAKNSEDPPLESLSGWFNATRSGILNERTGSRLEKVAVVVFDDSNDVAEENDRWAEDDDARPLYFVVPEPFISSPREAYEDEYVRVVLVGLFQSNVTTSNGILLGLALSRRMVVSVVLGDDIEAQRHITHVSGS
jgi:hypothetical protein